MPDVEETVPRVEGRPEVRSHERPSALQSRLAVHAPLDARPFADLIETVALKHGIDPELVHAVVQAESNYQPRAKSQRRARAG